MAKLPDDPTTRLERYLARLAGQDVSIPDTPITRIECYLAYLIENGGGAAAPNAGAHNAIFRGKSLGSSFTEAQADAISSGTFEDLYVGDYWTTISNRVLRIAGFDLFPIMASSDTREHYIVVVPDSPLYAGPMNETNTTAGGYLGSAMKTTGLDQALNMFRAFFGEGHIKPRTDNLTNAVSNGAPTGGAWTETYIDLMTEAQILGFGIGNSSASIHNTGISYSRFPLFEHMPKLITDRARSWFWIRDVVNAENFAIISTAGGLLPTSASASRGVRPFVCVA